MRFFYVFLFVFSIVFAAQAQELDSIKRALDTTKVDINDKAKVVTQDTVKETRQERKAREKAEKERAKYFYKDIRKDSTRLAIEHLSRVAWKRSLIVPGWGQYTNGGLWWIKVPVIYGGFISAVVIFDYWQWYYKKFGDEAAFRINNNGAWNDPDLQGIQQQDYLIRQKDYGRRNRDLTILATVGWWGLNIVEAYTTSILKYRYDMGDDLTMKIIPTVLPAVNQLAFTPSLKGMYAPGIKLTLSIK